MTVPPHLVQAVAGAFGRRVPQAVRYEHLLATAGVERGLIGPREQSRLWERHLLNSVAVAPLVPAGASLIDVGSGAGLPGVPLALGRSDLRVTLLEPLERRAVFLREIVDELGLADQVEVVRGRAQDLPGARFDTVTARAVAPLPRLLTWCLPLVGPAGTLLAVKGARAEDEIIAARSQLRQAACSAEVVECAVDGLRPTTRAVVVRRTRAEV